MLSLMFQCDRKGYLLLSGKPVTAAQLARMTGGATDEVSRLLTELKTSGVFSNLDDGTIYCRRMVRDEHERELNAERCNRYRKRKNPDHVTAPRNAPDDTRATEYEEETETGTGSLEKKSAPETRSAESAKLSDEADLAQLWANRYRGAYGATERNVYTLVDEFRDMLGRASVDEIKASIMAPDRLRSERLWQFRKRFQGEHKNGSANGQGSRYRYDQKRDG